MKHTQYELKTHLHWHIPLLNKVSSQSQLLQITSLKIEKQYMRYIEKHVKYKTICSLNNV